MDSYSKVLLKDREPNFAIQSPDVFDRIFHIIRGVSKGINLSRDIFAGNVPS
ncbi:hypothetical protein SELMODRAFT_123063 [Selaginella moellendorffii]|uniref:Uncharacterized protein n=1 Tax=Selaginella moellendorffii TaxID=88036 RepID=D8SR82_SELML|nr:hypothetical protein SELMODRAFT_123063 [Selaginella moellendorffii]